MKQDSRTIEIDELRGLSMIAMILIHATAYYKTGEIAFFLWNISQFAVPVFIFCSSYLFFKRQEIVSQAQFIPYLLKRFKRLLAPYYIFLLFYLPLVWIFEQQIFNTPRIIRYFLVASRGNDLSWLVLLFLMLSLIIPFVTFLNKRHKILFWTFGIVSFVSSIFLIVFPSPVNFKLIMWIPWTLMVYFTWYFVQEENSKERLRELFFTSTIAFAFLYFYLSQSGHSILQYDNKYPPNLYHLSYGISATLALYYLAKKKIFRFAGIRQLLSFLSIHSYSIYFVHFLILYVMTTFYRSILFRLPWWGFFGVLFTSALIAQSGIIKLKKLLIKE